MCWVKYSEYFYSQVISYNTLPSVDSIKILGREYTVLLFKNTLFSLLFKHIFSINLMKEWIMDFKIRREENDIEKADRGNDGLK